MWQSLGILTIVTDGNQERTINSEFSKGEDTAGIADQGHNSSLTASRKISSTFSDVSVRPLRYLPVPLGSGRFPVLAYTASASGITSLGERCSPWAIA